MCYFSFYLLVVYYMVDPYTGSQSVYAGVNAVNDSLFAKDSHLVEGKDDFEDRPVTVMMPAYRESTWVLEESLDSL